MPQWVRQVNPFLQETPFLDVKFKLLSIRHATALQVILKSHIHLEARSELYFPPPKPLTNIVVFKKTQTEFLKRRGLAIEKPSSQLPPPVSGCCRTRVYFWHKFSFREASKLQLFMEVQGRIYELAEFLNALPTSYLQFHSRNESFLLLFTINPKINYSANWNKGFPVNQMTPRAKF